MTPLKQRLHLIASWDISATGAMWDTYNDQMLDVLKPFPWVRPLNTYYLVPIFNAADRDRIDAGLKAVAALAFVEIKFLVSPPMPPALYAGVLPEEMWKLVNARVA